jgi:CubicO group peptidase (beta-lactamase class C family)
VSKPLTSAALVRLVEEGKIDLDAPIQKYVPSFPDKGALITPRMLAGHLGGIRHYKDAEVDSQKHYDTVVGGLERFQNDPLVVPPGTKFSYSSYGYNLLSAAIEAASGKPFLQTERELVFEPLALIHTTADEPAQIIEQRSRFYSREKGKSTENAQYVDNSYKWAGGGFLSTTEDLARFGSALLKPGFLKPESLALLFTPQKTKDGKETRYGMGWFIGKSKSGQRLFEHSGGSVGGSSELLVYPDAGLVVAFICNFSGSEDGWKGEEVQELGEGFEKK